MQSFVLFFKGDYAKFSNFYPVSVYYEGMEFPTLEHAYVAAKTLDMMYRRKIAVIPAEDAGKAKRIGRNKKLILRPNWDLMKVSIMRRLIDQKFNIPEFKDLLLSTKNRKIIEGNYWHDNFWGDCQCQKCSGIQGKNTLGKLLMKKREDQCRQIF